MTMPRKKPPFPPPVAAFGEETVIGGHNGNEQNKQDSGDAHSGAETRDAEQYDYELTSVGSEVSAIGQKAQPMDVEKTVVGKQNALDDAFGASTVVQPRPQRFGEKTAVGISSAGAQQTGPPPIVSRAVVVDDRSIKNEPILKAMPKAPAAIDLHNDLLNEKTVVRPPSSPQPAVMQVTERTPETRPIPQTRLDGTGAGSQLPEMPETGLSHSAHNRDHDIENHHDHEAHETDLHGSLESGSSRLGRLKTKFASTLPWLKSRNGMISVAVVALLIFAVAHKHGDNDPAEIHQTEFSSEGKPVRVAPLAEHPPAVPVPGAPAAPPPNAGRSGQTASTGQSRADSVLQEFDRAFARTQDQR